MKANKIENRGRRITVIIAAILLIVLAVGAKFGYDSLSEVYHQQFVIHDMSTQVEITSGKMVHPATIAEVFGLKNGKNMAEIDFCSKREEILAKIPNLRAIRVTRYLPGRLSIVAEERVPIAKINARGQKSTSGRVVDAEGMVFMCQRGTQTLPTIFEPQAPGVHAGQYIKDRTLAALKLIEVCREPEYQELGILAVDTSKHDFLTATLGNYSKVKILWEDMDTPSIRSRRDLESRLTLLRNAIRNKITPNAVTWNATIPGKIFADTQGAL